jgi:hypothetical protein
MLQSNSSPAKAWMEVCPGMATLIFVLNFQAVGVLGW